MWIYLLRHGDAEDHAPGTPDTDRALTATGARKLADARASWREVLRPPEVVFTSPLLRARQTADVLLGVLEEQVELRVDDALVPGAPVEQMVTKLEGELFSKTSSVALVGHEPHLGYLLGSLLTGHTRLSVPLKKGMLVGVRAEGTTSLFASLRFALSQKVAAQLA